MFCHQVDEYMEALEELMIKREDGIRLMPELYAVPADKVSIQGSRQGVPRLKKRHEVKLFAHSGCTPMIIGISVHIFWMLVKRATAQNCSLKENPQKIEAKNRFRS